MRSELGSGRSDFSRSSAFQLVSPPTNYSISAFGLASDQYSNEVIAPADSFTRVNSAATLLIIVFDPFDEIVTSTSTVAGYQALSDYTASKLTSAADALSLGAQGVRAYGPARSELSADAVLSAGQPSANTATRVTEAPATLENRPSDATANKGGTASPTSATALLARPTDTLIARADIREPVALSTDGARPNGQAALVLASQRSLEASRNAAIAEVRPALQEAGAQAGGASQNNAPFDREAEIDPKLATPALAGLLGDIGRVDATSLERGLQQFLRDLDAVGGQVVQQASDVGWVNWVAPAIAASALAAELARRRIRRTHLELVFGSKTADTTWSWFPQGDEPRSDSRS
jgi:hypothetical protein